MPFVLVIMCILTLTACGSSDLDTGDATQTVSPTTREVVETANPVEDFLSQDPVQDTTDAENPNNISYPIYDNSIGLNTWDFNVAYQMCQDAIAAYYTYPDADFNSYIENNQLKEYLIKSAEWESRKRQSLNIGIANSEFCESDSNGLKWFYFYITITFPDGGVTTEIIVKESLDGESLVIGDWYFPGNLPLDDQTRKNSGRINDPDIWENSVFADNMIKKAQEILEHVDSNNVN